MQRTQQLASGLVVRQDFRDAARLVFFASDIPEFPFWTPGGTAFVVNFESRPYLVTCAHVINQAPSGDEPVITNVKFGNEPVRAKAIHRVHDLDGGVLDADMADVVVLSFDMAVSVGAFVDSAYVINADTVGTSERGDALLAHGTLKQRTYIDSTEIVPSYATLEFEDVGATSEDPFIREATATYEDADFTSLSGLSGSPTFNSTRNYLCGMVVRGGMSAGLARIRYIDMFDIMKLLESVHADNPRITYNKNVKRRGKLT